EDDNLPSEGLPCQLSPKEINPGTFTIPCTIGSLDFYAMADLGASINVMPKSIGDLPDNGIKCYWESANDDERINLTWENISLNDWMKIRYGKTCKSTRDRILKDHWKEKSGEEDDDTDEGWKDPEKCREEKNRRNT
nr:phospholipase-like protein [Tanacetum cinerariifolium]